MKRFGILFVLISALIIMTCAVPAAAISFIDTDNHCSFETPADWEKEVLYVMDSTLSDEKRQELSKEYEKYDVLYRVRFDSSDGVMLYGGCDISGSYKDENIKDLDTAFYFQHMELDGSDGVEIDLDGNYIVLKEKLSTTYIHAEYGNVYQFEFKGNRFEESDISYVLRSAFFFPNIMRETSPSHYGTVSRPFSSSPSGSSSSCLGSGTMIWFILLMFVVIIAGPALSKRSKKSSGSSNSGKSGKTGVFGNTGGGSSYKSNTYRTTSATGNAANKSNVLLPETPLTREEATSQLIHLVTAKGLFKEDAEKRLNNILKRCPELETAFPLDEKQRFLRYVCPSEPSFSDDFDGKDKYHTLRVGGSGYKVKSHAIGDLLEYSLRLVDNKPQVYIAYVDDWGLLYSYDAVEIPEETASQLTPETLTAWMSKNASPYDYAVEEDFGFSFEKIKEDPRVALWCKECGSLYNEALKKREAPSSDNEIIDDMTYIKQMKHSSSGVWQRYDVLLAARAYGWEDAVSWADYMATSDLEGISTVTTAPISGAPETERIVEYAKAKKSIKKMPSLKNEYGVICVGGISRTLMAPVKMAFYNQTKTLAVMTPVDDDELMNRYIETAIRRIFDTPDAMKRAKPYTEN